MKHKKININSMILLTICCLCLLTTLIQGIPYLAGIPGDYIRNGCLFLMLLPLPVLFYLYKKNKLTEESIVFSIILSGMIFHCSYILLSGLYDRQHDEGYYTGIASSQINPGHIGYIEYIYKFRHLPDINPYQLFSYYHPPLHYVLSGIWLILLTALGMPEQAAFENLQILPLFYFGLLMLLTYHILKKTGAGGRGLYAGLFLVAMHPSLVIMSGSVNNDMLSTLLLSCCIFTALCWLKERTLKNLLAIAVCTGLGMLCKINTAVIAFPLGLIFLLDFIKVLGTKQKKPIFSAIRNYALFLFTAAGIGLSWIIRNILLFHTKPGISSATEASIMYTGNYSLWERIGIPALTDWHFAFPFHPLSGDVIHNTWVILFQTALFAEVYPADITAFPLLLCKIAYISSIIFAIGAAVLFFVIQYTKMKKATGLEALFLSTGYFIVLFSFILFSIKYPYTCSSDFRYIVICLLYMSMGIADSSTLYQGHSFLSTATRILRYGIYATLLLTTLIYMTWKQW